MSSTVQEGSVVLAVLREIKLKCLSVAEYSRLWNLLVCLADQDQLQTVFAHRFARLNRLVDSSGSHRLYDATVQQLSIAAKTAVLTSIILFWHRAVRSSALYRWLTTEPDPDVIVIDLRETKTVGPVIRSIDRLWSMSLTATPDSRVVRLVESTVFLFRDRPIRVVSLTSMFVLGSAMLVSAIMGTLTSQSLGVVVGVMLLAVAGLRSDASLAELRETRVAKLLVAALEPPKPPESYTEQQAVDTKANENAGSDDPPQN